MNRKTCKVANCNGKKTEYVCRQCERQSVKMDKVKVVVS
jgi:hypothetical protein